MITTTSQAAMTILSRAPADAGIAGSLRPRLVDPQLD
jgi:hypothetical protein